MEYRKGAGPNVCAQSQNVAQAGLEFKILLPLYLLGVQM